MATEGALDERIVVVDLQKDYDRALLNDYFNNILQPYFGVRSFLAIIDLKLSR